jgi:hypothetical protein
VSGPLPISIGYHRNGDALRQDSQFRHLFVINKPHGALLLLKKGAELLMMF